MCAFGLDAVRRQPRKAASVDPLDDWRAIHPKVPLHFREVAADRSAGCRSVDTTPRSTSNQARLVVERPSSGLLCLRGSALV